jgi:hypothetical protein
MAASPPGPEESLARISAQYQQFPRR